MPSAGPAVAKMVLEIFQAVVKLFLNPSQLKLFLVFSNKDWTSWRTRTWALAASVVYFPRQNVSGQSELQSDWQTGINVLQNLADMPVYEDFWRKVYSDRLTRFQQSTGSPSDHIVMIGAPPDTTLWRNDWELCHDAESLSWLLVWCQWLPLIVAVLILHMHPYLSLSCCIDLGKLSKTPSTGQMIHTYPGFLRISGPGSSNATSWYWTSSSKNFREVQLELGQGWCF